MNRILENQLNNARGRETMHSIQLNNVHVYVVSI